MMGSITFPFRLSRKRAVSGVLVAMAAVISAKLLTSVGGEELSRETIHAAAEKARKGDTQPILQLQSQMLTQSKTFRPPSAMRREFEAMLKDPNTDVQVLGACGLNALKSRESMDALVEYITEVNLRQMEASNKRAQPPVGETGDSQRNRLKAATIAIMTLGEIGDDSVIPLLESLRNLDCLSGEFGGGAAQQALSRLGVAGVKSLSNIRPGDAYGENGMKAHAAIRSIRDARQIPALIATTNDDNVHVGIRMAAVGALAEMKSADVFPFLGSVIQDDSYPVGVRMEAARGVSGYKDRAAENLLLHAIETTTGSLRAACVATLARCDARRYIPQGLRFVIDNTNPLSEREQVALWLPISHADALTSDVQQLLDECLQASTSEDKPADEIRISAWRIIFGMLDKEPVLEVRDVQTARFYLRDHVKGKARKMRLPYDQEKAWIDNKLQTLVTQWQEI